MRRTIRIADIDRRGDDADGCITFAVHEEREQFRRWRPAIVRGDTGSRFLDSYFRHVAPMPWSGLITLRDAEVVGDGLILQGDTLFVGESLMYPPSVFPYSHSALKFDRQGDHFEVDVPDEVVLIEGITANIVCDGWPIYGHWLVDVLPRLYRVMSSGVEVDKYLLPGPPREWQLRMLESVGLDIERCIFVDFAVSTARCEHMVVPTYDRYNSEIRPALVRVHEELRRRALGDAPSPVTRDLFVSRKGWGGSRALQNRGAVERAFEDLGFEIVRPEALAFLDQIRLFASARSVVGECGSGMHNTIFSGAGTKVCLLQSAANFNFLQSQIGMMLDQEVYYVLGKPEPTGSDGFSIELQDARYIGGILRKG